MLFKENVDFTFDDFELSKEFHKQKKEELSKTVKRFLHFLDKYIEQEENFKKSKFYILINEDNDFLIVKGGSRAIVVSKLLKHFCTQDPCIMYEFLYTVVNEPYFTSEKEVVEKEVELKGVGKVSIIEVPVPKKMSEVIEKAAKILKKSSLLGFDLYEDISIL
jgi:hypothetical protein